MNPRGSRRIIAISGGTFAGPHLRGRVLPGGAWLMRSIFIASGERYPNEVVLRIWRLC